MGQYGTETVRNLPGSLKGVGEDLWGAVTDPVGTMQGDGQNRSRRGAARQRLHAGIPSTEMLTGDSPGSLPVPLASTWNDMDLIRIGQTLSAATQPGPRWMSVGWPLVPGAASRCPGRVDGHEVRPAYRRHRCSATEDEDAGSD